MDPFRRIDRPRAFRAMALLVLWILNSTAFHFPDLFRNHQASSALDAAGIEAPDHVRETCEHHPEGCPKDCLCPKIKPPLPGESPSMAGLFEPSFRQCTGSAHHASVPASFLCIGPPPSVSLTRPERSAPMPGPRISRPLEPFSHPLLKIPIA